MKAIHENNKIENQASQRSNQDKPSLLLTQDEVGSSEFLAAYGESLAQTLDLDTWERGENLAKNLAGCGKTHFF